ncbi:MAG: hypothetical protein P1P84_03030 [Deferrisomatales bacterium]|nr:hypothetical protein [Deferrisomatales bacterium]
MGIQNESFIKKTQKGLSILAFETTKQSRILKKRMRTAALQKEVKADLRDLGNLVYNALINDQAGILEEEEVKILVENIRDNKAEVEHLRDAMARLNRSRKHFEEEFPFEAPPAAAEGKKAEEKAAEAPASDAEPLLEPKDEKKSTKPKSTSSKTATNSAAKPAPSTQGAKAGDEPGDAGKPAEEPAERETK